LARGALRLRQIWIGGEGFGVLNGCLVRGSGRHLFRCIGKGGVIHQELARLKLDHGQFGVRVEG